MQEPEISVDISKMFNTVRDTIKGYVSTFSIQTWGKPDNLRNQDALKDFGSIPPILKAAVLLLVKMWNSFYWL